MSLLSQTIRVVNYGACDLSPELTPNGSRDFTVYVLDPLEAPPYVALARYISLFDLILSDIVQEHSTQCLLVVLQLGWVTCHYHCSLLHQMQL